MKMKMKIVENPTVFVAIVEVGEDYTERLITIKANRCTLEEAQQLARDVGYQVITDLCSIVPTTHEVQITVAVEPETESNKKWRLQYEDCVQQSEGKILDQEGL